VLCWALLCWAWPDEALADDLADDAASHSGSQSDPVEVTVQGQRALLRHSPREPTAASSVLTGEQLRRVGDSSLDVLALVPGVQLRRTGSEVQSASLSLRGTDSWATPVYVAGIRINDELTGTADLSSVPLWMVQRVEVFRGNAPFSSERLGLSGAVFFEPKRAQATRVGAAASLGSQSERGLWLMGETGNAHASTLVALRRHEARGDSWFLNDHGQRFTGRESRERRANSDHTEYDAWAVSQLHLARGHEASLVVNAFEREQGAPGVATTPAEAARAQRRRFLAGLTSTSECAQHGACRLTVHSSLLQEGTTLRDPLRELGAVRSTWMHVRGTRGTHGLRVQIQPPGAAWELSLSGGWAQDRLEIERLGFRARRAARQELTLGARVGVRPVASLTTQLAVTLRCEHSEGEYEERNVFRSSAQTSCVQGKPEARLGAEYDLGGSWSLLSNLAHSVRLPTLGERYGTSSEVVGNPGLNRESSVSADVGVRGQHRVGPAAFALDSFVFARWATELVRYRRNSFASFSPYNVSSARVLGWETAFASQWYGLLETHTALTLLDPRETTGAPDTTRNDVLPLSSRLTMTHAFGLYSPLAWLGAERAGVGVRYFHASSRFADPAGLAVLPAQDFWDLEAQLAWARPDVTLRASVDNVFDEHAVDWVGYPLPTRAFHTSLEVWW
jgi:iron complex outermembrane receptor protein